MKDYRSALICFFFFAVIFTIFYYIYGMFRVWNVIGLTVNSLYIYIKIIIVPFIVFIAIIIKEKSPSESSNFFKRLVIVITASCVLSELSILKSEVDSLRYFISLDSKDAANINTIYQDPRPWPHHGFSLLWSKKNGIICMD